MPDRRVSVIEVIKRPSLNTNHNVYSYPSNRVKIDLMLSFSHTVLHIQPEQATGDDID